MRGESQILLGLSLAQTVLLIATVTVSGVFDLRYRRIPNWITIPGLLLGLGLNAFPPGAGLPSGLLGVLVAAIVYIPLYLVRGMGAGDVKLMAAIGAIVGSGNWIAIFIATALVGGIAALGLVLLRDRFQQTMFNLFVLLRDLAHFRAPYQDSASLDVRNANALRLPHGVSIACGTLIALTFSRLKWI